MARTVQTRTELLRQWLADLTAPGVERVQLTPEQLRLLAEDAIFAKALYAALAELVLCKHLKARMEPMQPGPERNRVMGEYSSRVGPAWDAAFDALGVDRLKT